MAEGITPREADNNSARDMQLYKKASQDSLQAARIFHREMYTLEDTKILDSPRQAEIVRETADLRVLGERTKQQAIADARVDVATNSGAYHDAARIDATLDGVEIKTEDSEPK